MLPDTSPDFLSLITSHVFNMHRWQKMFLSISLLLFGTGSAGQITGLLARHATPAAATSVDSQNPPPESSPSLTERLAPWATRVGASFIGGFLLGFALRVFVRVTATLLVVAASIMMLLSYFNVMNLDLTAARTKYETSIHWAQDQAYRLKEAAQSHLPSSGSGTIGAFAGFRRRKSRG